MVPVKIKANNLQGFARSKRDKVPESRVRERKRERGKERENFPFHHLFVLFHA